MSIRSLSTSTLTSQTRYANMSTLVGEALSLLPVSVPYVVVAGGGGGGFEHPGQTDPCGAGGGAGGYRSSVFGESSGGGASAETPLTLASGTYQVKIGAGGAGFSSGSQSIFSTVTCVGGGHAPDNRNVDGISGGSGSGGFTYKGNTGGGNSPSPGGPGTAGQGFDGGDHNGSVASGDRIGMGAGGGGAGSAGGPNPNNRDGGDGGQGVISTISGTPTYRAGGGAGSSNSGANGSAINGATAADSNGASNSGSGAGGPTSETTTQGGSGVVIFKVPQALPVSFSVGVTKAKSTIGNEDVYTVTAAGPTDEVTIGF